MRTMFSIHCTMFNIPQIVVNANTLNVKLLNRTDFLGRTCRFYATGDTNDLPTIMELLEETSDSVCCVGESE